MWVKCLSNSFSLVCFQMQYKYSGPLTQCVIYIKCDQGHHFSETANNLVYVSLVPEKNLHFKIQYTIIVAMQIRKVR